MATAQSVKAKLQGLIDSANAATGGTAATVHDAVAELIGGYGGGDGADQSVGVIDGTLTEYVSTELTTIRPYAFYQHAGLQKITAHNCTGTCEANAFRNCKNLSLVDVSADKILTACFGGCSNLKTIVLRKAGGVCSIQNISVFTDTPFASGGTGGTVYVPSALIAQYQQATNWSTLYAAGTCIFAAIEGSEYE